VRGQRASSEQGFPHEDPATAIQMVVGQSEAMHKVATMIRQVAAYPTTVMLQGESGTGKDVAAQAIHLLSRRASRPFIALNCAAIPGTLLETELFGVEAGAFTDAKTLREGHLLRADGGTLFLDEIGSMPLGLQTKLLRFLETRSFRRVGGTREIHVDLRVISATNIDLKTAVAHKEFREDLYYRLEVIAITLPPLRERPEDIEPLIEHFLQQHSEDTEPLRVSPAAMKFLLQYSWPGNVRQLRSTLQRGQILCDDRVIYPKDLPDDILKAGSSASLRLRELQAQLTLPSEGVDLPAFLNHIEHKFVQDALERCHGNQVQAAAILHMSRDQLRYRLSHS
jgi:two-component system, NtrC family, response regulator AtoC